MTHPFIFTSPTDKMTGAWHGAYLKAYALIFAPLRDTKESVGEIGVDGGGSLLMYADYFHSATAVGMDISQEPEAIIGHPRIKFHQENAYGSKGYDAMKDHGPFALLVDDGPHTIESQKHFCAHYPHLLIPNGIAIVEDVQRIEHFKTLSDALSPEFFGFGIDLRMHDGRYDNLIFVIQRR